jgi:magnesium transporter
MLRLTRDLLPFLSKLGDSSSPAIQSLKDEADRLYFYSDDLVETSNDLVQLSISLTSNRTNQVVRMLTLVSIFLLPLNLVAGIYGMNFRHMPELDWKYGYPTVMLFMILVELGIYWRLKHKKWIR